MEPLLDNSTYDIVITEQTNEIDNKKIYLSKNRGESCLKKIYQAVHGSSGWTEDSQNNGLIRIPYNLGQNPLKKYPIFDYSVFTGKLKTSNLVGVVKYTTNDGEEFRLKIQSRFDKGKNQYFLLYMLSKCLNINLFDTNIEFANESEFQVLLVVLFYQSFLEAITQGVYKEYRKFEYNDFNFKGSLNVNNHLKYNTPFIGKTAYRTREHTYDNNILCLIRQTINYIETSYCDLWEGVVKNNKFDQYAQYREIIFEATKSYIFNKNYNEVYSCRKPIVHPFYDKYETLRQLCLAILDNDGANIYIEETESVKGILFDVAWLWEEFVYKQLLEEYKFIHLEFNGNRGLNYLKDVPTKVWYPDFIEDINSRENFQGASILDAKYKDWHIVKQSEDMHQLISYLYITGGKMCGAIFPHPQSVEETKVIVFQELKSNISTKVKCYEFCLDIPDSSKFNNYEAYSYQFEKNISQWKERFEGIIKV